MGKSGKKKRRKDKDRKLNDLEADAEPVSLEANQGAADQIPEVDR